MAKKQLSDEQLDGLMRSLINRSAVDDALVSEIADSPAAWWGVQRKINEQKGVTLSPWPPIGNALRWLMVGVPLTAAAVLILSFFVFKPATNIEKGAVAVIPTTNSAIAKPAEPVNAPSEPTDVKTEFSNVTSTARQVVRHVATKPHYAIKRTAAKTTETTARAAKKEEIKTDFIALSYARDPESGQIVRVKVPSAMMVSLGLVASVKKPSDLVDAEVLVGDDGLTRAIRFIR